MSSLCIFLPLLLFVYVSAVDDDDCKLDVQHSQVDPDAAIVDFLNTRDGLLELERPFYQSPLRPTASSSPTEKKSNTSIPSSVFIELDQDFPWSLSGLTYEYYASPSVKTHSNRRKTRDCCTKQPSALAAYLVPVLPTQWIFLRTHKMEHETLEIARGPLISPHATRPQHAIRPLVKPAAFDLFDIDAVAEWNTAHRATSIYQQLWHSVGSAICLDSSRECFDSAARLINRPEVQKFLDTDCKLARDVGKSFAFIQAMVGQEVTRKMLFLRGNTFYEDMVRFRKYAAHVVHLQRQFGIEELKKDLATERKKTELWRKACLKTKQEEASEQQKKAVQIMCEKVKEETMKLEMIKKRLYRLQQLEYVGRLNVHQRIVREQNTAKRNGLILDEKKLLEIPSHIRQSTTTALSDVTTLWFGAPEQLNLALQMERDQQTSSWRSVRRVNLNHLLDSIVLNGYELRGNHRYHKRTIAQVIGVYRLLRTLFDYLSKSNEHDLAIVCPKFLFWMPSSSAKVDERTIQTLNSTRELMLEKLRDLAPQITSFILPLPVRPYQARLRLPALATALRRMRNLRHFSCEMKRDRRPSESKAKFDQVIRPLLEGLSELKQVTHLTLEGHDLFNVVAEETDAREQLDRVLQNNALNELKLGNNGYHLPTSIELSLRSECETLTHLQISHIHLEQVNGAVAQLSHLKVLELREIRLSTSDLHFIILRSKPTIETLILDENRAVLPAAVPVSRWVWLRSLFSFSYDFEPIEDVPPTMLFDDLVDLPNLKALSMQSCGLDAPHLDYIFDKYNLNAYTFEKLEQWHLNENPRLFDVDQSFLDWKVIWKRCPVLETISLYNTGLTVQKLNKLRLPSSVRRVVIGGPFPLTHAYDKPILEVFQRHSYLKTITILFSDFRGDLERAAFKDELKE